MGYASLSFVLCDSCVLVVHGMFVRRPGVALVIRRWGDLTPDSQDPEEEALKPVQGFTRFRPPRFGLMTVGHTDPVRQIRIPQPSTHARKATGTGRRGTDEPVGRTS
jgi:hypothetical protein